MRISLGLSAALAPPPGSKPAARAAARIERRENEDNRVMMTSIRYTAIALPQSESRRLATTTMEAGLFARRQLGDGAGPGVLAAFVKRPQAARSNRRCLYLKIRARGVNEKVITRPVSRGARCSPLRRAGRANFP